jgi:predicted ATPase
VNVVEELVDQARVVQDAGGWRLKENLATLNVPSNVRQLIEQQVERLSEEEQRVLEAASVAGTEFTVAAIAAALKQEIDIVEDICEGLVWQGLFLTERGIAEWPEGTVSGRYSFRHALYQNVLYERIAEARRVRLHRLIGERTERGYGERAGEIAAELAVHFERGHEYRRAVQYCEQAGRNAIQRSAHVEAVSLLTKGLELLKTLPDTPERAQQELTLQNILGVSLRAIMGYANPEVERTYKRALDLCQQMGETPQLFPALYGLFGFYIVGAKHKTAHELAEQLLSVAQRRQDPALLLEAHRALGQTALHRGEFVRARDHFEQGVALYDPQQHGSHAFAYAGDPRVVCLDTASIALWQLGYPEQAVKRSDEAIALAQEISHPFSLAHALWFAAMLHQYRRDERATQEQAETLITLCNKQGFAFWLVGGTIFRGWALAGQGQEEEGIAQIRQGIVAWQATGAGRFQHYFLALLAEACGTTERTEEGLALLTEAVAVAHKDGDHLDEPELYRLQGELTLQQERQKSKGKGQKAKVPNTQHPAPMLRLKRAS